MKLIVLSDAEKAAEYAALHVVKRISEFDPTEHNHFVLGLPVGSSTINFYKALIKLHLKKRVSFQFVTTFSMISYVGVDINHESSVETFLWKNFFKFIDINPKNVHVMNGNARNPEVECDNYEKLLEELGPIDLLISDIHPDGYIGFNEPGSSLNSLTRMKPVSVSARRQMADDFGRVDKVPTMVLTVGVGIMLNSKSVLLYVIGSERSLALQRVVEGGVTQMCTCSSFQLHPNVTIVCDFDATMELKVKTLQYYKEVTSSDRYQSH